jgi:hypothetical protein
MPLMPIPSAWQTAMRPTYNWVGGEAVDILPKQLYTDIN